MSIRSPSRLHVLLLAGVLSCSSTGGQTDAGSPSDATSGTDLPSRDGRSGEGQAARCGNGVREGAEQCDAADVPGACTHGGTLKCKADCTYDTSGCLAVVCGNGKVEGNEKCDGQDLGGASCASLGLGSGTLKCKSCAFDTSGCCGSVSEKLDGVDNNCNGKIDEGFWAQMITVANSDLAKQQCQVSAFDYYCAAAASNSCYLAGYVGGFGPIEVGTTSSSVACVADAKLMESISWYTLTKYNADCLVNKPNSGPPCRTAIDQYCVANGYLGGLGPTETFNPVLTSFLCVNHVNVKTFPSFPTALTTYSSNCTAATAFSFSCQAATHKFCVANGNVTGYGPIALPNGSYRVLCLPSQ